MTTVAMPTYYRGSEAGKLSFAIGLNLYIASIYTNIAVTVGGFLVVGVIGIAGAILMIRHIRNLFWLGWLIFFLTVSLVAGGSGGEMFGYRLSSWLQIIAALGCAHILLCAMDYRETVRKTLFLWLMFITVGVILETVFPPIRDLSETFRQIIFDGRFIYDYDGRDLLQYGFVRPKLFTQEPSHISKAFVAFGVGWYLLSSRRRFTVLLICTILTTLFLRSPFVLLALPLAWFLARMASGRTDFRIAAAGFPLLGIFVVVLT